MIEIFARGFTIVFLVAFNVHNVAAGRYLWAFVSGAAVSIMWWSNAHTAAIDPSPWASINYALGAGLGTMAGMWLGKKVG